MELLLYFFTHISPFKPNCPFRDSITIKGYALSEEGCNRHLPRILLYSRLYGLPSDLILSKVIVESGFRDNIVSKEGATGLLQVTPIARKDIGTSVLSDDLLVGILYFKKLLNKYKNEDLALAAYNAGPAHINRYKGIPPFKETRDHIKKVKEVRTLINFS